MSFASKAFNIFEKSVNDYHVINKIDQEIKNPFPQGIDNMLYSKNWIDTVQWHLEDEIRVPNISAEEGMKLKRQIDLSNQNRTDLVEQIDDYFLESHKSSSTKQDARLNTESPAWAIDRLSILALKLYHMQLESSDENSSIKHRESCHQKLLVLQEQKIDLMQSIDELLDNIKDGEVVMKVYRQMKMYNDPNMNPKLKSE